MGRSIESKIAAHARAGERRAAGLPTWAGKLDVSDVFHDDSTEVWAKAGVITDRIRKAAWFDEHDPDLEDILFQLDALSVDAEGDLTEATDEFDAVWDEFYDWCDLVGRIWVRTF